MRNGRPDRGRGERLPTNRQAFAGLFDRFFRPLAGYARLYTGSEAAACDIVQDVFVKLWEERRSITIRSSLQALLYTMVRNRALNYRRDRKRLQFDASAEEAAEAQAGPILLDEEPELRRLLHGWVDELPERRREAFMLSRFHDLSHAEIADVMQVSERTVDTHILLALRSLRSRFDRLRQEDEQT